jgi:7-carboxy-7-deazaguanine synthase
MRCVWCDSEYTFSGGEHISLEDVLKQVRALGSRLVEVTGGEPLAQKEAHILISRLCDEGFEVLIETGGYFSTAEIDERAKIILDVKCPDSGEEARNHWPNLERLRAAEDEVKFVIASRRDWEYALEVVRRFDLEKAAKAVLISPAWDEIDLKDLAEWVARSELNLRMQLQLHKYIWGPEVQGV